MVGRPIAEREVYHALVAAQRNAEERYAASSAGMQETATHLRHATERCGRRLSFP